MKRSDIIRLAFFTAVTVLLMVCSVLYGQEAFHVLHPIQELTADEGAINVDGSDFTGIFNLFAEMFGGFIHALIMMAYTVLVIIFSLVIILILRAASIRKNSVVSIKEITLSNRIMWICTAAAYIVCIASTSYVFAGYALLLFWQTPLFSKLIYLNTLNSHMRTDKDEISEEI